MEKKIYFIITGGTIDSFYDPKTESGKPLQKSVIPGYIKDSIRPYANFTFKTLFMKDSGDITPADRKKILRTVKTTKTKHIIISHGTVTMEKTAEFLKKNLPKELKKTVILTGAMTPLKVDMSDGGFNLGFAASAALTQRPGVYIAMHGEIFPAGTVTKNKKKARFETKKK